MELRKVIKTTLRKYLNEEQMLKEYVTREIVYLKDYFKMPDSTKIEYLPYEHYGYFRDFLEETDTDFEEPPSEYTGVDGENVFMFEGDMELITWLEKNNKELFTEFGEYLFEKIKNNNLPIPDADYPAWSFFNTTPELIKNQWLIHFTKDAYGIAEDGFKYGVDDMSKLGLTTHLSEFDKIYGGYNFAYTLGDFEKYGRSSGWHGVSKYKYGNEAVVFNASGIKVWHYGDEEPQVIFYGNTAKNIIPIRYEGDDGFYIKSKKGRVLYKNEKLPKVVDWIKNNYQQYRKNFVF